MTTPRFIRNTSEEEAAIQRGIDADPNTFVPTDKQFAQMKRRGSAMNPSLKDGAATDSEKAEDPK